MSGEFAPVFDAAHRAVLASGKNLVYVSPPAGWAAAPLFAQTEGLGRPGLQTLILPPGTEAAHALADGLRSLSQHQPVHVVTGLARSETLLRGGSLTSLIATAADAMELVRRAALKLEGLRRVVVAWPEAGPANQASALDTLLSEAAGAQRLIVTTSEHAIVDFLERHARRALLMNAAPLPDAPGGPLTYVVAGTGQLRASVVAAADVLHPASLAIWGPGPTATERDPAALTALLPGAQVWESGGPATDLIIALDLPSAELLAELRATSRQLLVLVAGWQFSYLSRLAAPVTPLRLPGAADRARDRVFALRQRLRERLRAGGLEPELLVLEPLFDEHDPALVAAAVLALGGSPTAAPAGAAELPAWVRIRVNVGRRADVRIADLVGALLHGVRLAKEDVGKVDLHDGFALVDVRPAVAEQTVRELNAMTLRGRRLTATIDRR